MEKELDPKRYEHTLGVAYTAASLAMCYGADLNSALIAGMLHDCAKCLSNEKKISICKKHDLPINPAEEKNPFLLHAKVGSYLASKKYGVTDPDILNAILNHTTGRPDMSLLEKIVWLSDYIEPGRKQAPNLPEIRRIAFEDLDKALVMALENTLSYLKGGNMEIDSMTQKTYDFYKNIYVVASQQNLHFQQWFKVIELMGYDWAKDCVHVPFGLVSMEDGTMSTRQGRVVFLEDVLNRAVEQTKQIILEKNVTTENIDETAHDVGVGAVVFNELSNYRIKDYVFSWDKVLNFEGETGPYVQYTHARACSILRRAGEDTVKAAKKGFDTSWITGESAHHLIKLLYALPEVIKEAGEKYEPSIVTRHIVDIAQGFNKFYHDEHILVEDEKEKTAKVALVLAVQTAIKNGLGLLGMKAPEKM